MSSAFMLHGIGSKSAEIKDHETGSSLWVFSRGRWHRRIDGLWLCQMDESFDVCEDVIMQEALSPDAHLKAIVYSRSCGIFSTGMTTQVAVVKDSDSLPKEAGNVYVERSEASQPQVWVQWEGRRSLLVADDPKVSGRAASWAQKQVRVDLGWLRSAQVSIRYAAIPSQKSKARL